MVATNAPSDRLEQLRRQHMAVLCGIVFVLSMPVAYSNFMAGFWVRASMLITGQGLLLTTLVMLKLGLATRWCAWIAVTGFFSGVALTGLFQGGFTDPRTVLALALVFVWSSALLSFVSAARILGLFVVLVITLFAAHKFGILQTIRLPGFQPVDSANLLLAQLLGLGLGLYLLIRQNEEAVRTLIETSEDLVTAESSVELLGAQSAVALDIARVGVFVIDPESGSHEVNDIYRRLLELPAAEYPQVSLDAIRERATPTQLEIILEAIKTRSPISIDRDKVQLPSGLERYLSTRAQTISIRGRDYFIGAIIDETEQVARESELERALSDLIRTCEATNTGLSELDTVTGLITANSVWRRMFDFDERQQVDIDAFLQRLPEYERERATVFTQLVRESSAIERIDYDYVGRDGAKKRLRSVAQGFALADDGYVIKSVDLDITDLYEKQTELLARAEQQRTMFGIISHELRTPAAGIKLLCDELDLDPATRAQFSAVIDNLISVVDDLKVAINPEAEISIRPAPFTVGELMIQTERQSADFVKGSGLRLTVSGASNDKSRYVSDIHRLRSVLRLFIRNSVIHSGGARVWLSADIANVDDHTLLTLRVEDDGKGIPSDQVERLFLPFERGDKSSLGAGLGLYLARKWVNKLGGQVNFSESTRGGACFTVSIPVQRVQKDSEEEKAKALIAEARAAIKGKRVLVVEDDHLLMKITPRILEKQFGVQVILAEDGERALEVLQRESVELIMTDYFMPNLNGRDLILELRRQGRLLPIIALTAATIGAEHDELMQAGADFVLAKPLDIVELSECVVTLTADGKIDRSEA